MSRIIERHNLASKDARRRLGVRERPYWSMTVYGRHVGYHKRGSRRAYWVARYRTLAGSYHQHRLGRADDFLPADGHSVLTYEQAWEVARVWFQSPRHRDQSTEEGRRGVNEDLSMSPIGDTFTVGHAMHDYMTGSDWRLPGATFRSSSASSTTTSCRAWHRFPRRT